MNECDIYRGAKKNGSGLTMNDIWQRMHVHAECWGRLTGIDAKKNRCSYDTEDVELLKSMHELQAICWERFVSGSGITVYGSIALSWCQDAELAQVWEGWQASGFPLKPLPEYERPARFLNPALVPQFTSLSAILGFVNDQNIETPELYDLAISATIVAQKSPIDFDLPLDAYKTVRPQVAAFLKSRMLQKPSRTAEEEALIMDWSAKVKGTEFDVWEGA